MAIEMNNTSGIKLSSKEEISLNKSTSELYVGQILKAVVMAAPSNNQVMLNINGQNLNARSSHHFTPGELLELKVLDSEDETILEIQTKIPSPSILQNALLQNLPRQAPPTYLLQMLNQLKNSSDLPALLTDQIKTILDNIFSLSQLEQQFIQAIKQSGLFLESSLFEWQQNMNPQQLKKDFKGQCVKLLKSLPLSTEVRNNLCLPSNLESRLLEQDTLPLPGAIPQPLHKDFLLNLLDISPLKPSIPFYIDNLFKYWRELLPIKLITCLTITKTVFSFCLICRLETMKTLM